MNDWCFKACRQLRSYWAHLHIKHKCEVEITYMCNNTFLNGLETLWEGQNAGFLRFPLVPQCILNLSLLIMTKDAFVDSVDQDKTV